MVKIERSYPAPESLVVEAQKSSGKYDKPDVIERLRADSHNKCYLCELKELQDPVVEHLLPHKDGKYPDRKFAWDNLFWACNHCNGVKNKTKYDEKILDCCKDDPEELISFRIVNYDVNVEARDVANEKAVVTASLVEEIFNVKNTGMRVYRSDMRLKQLNIEMNNLYRNLEEMKNNPGSIVILRKIKAILRREAAFAAFKREYIRVNADKYPELISYIS